LNFRYAHTGIRKADTEAVAHSVAQRRALPLTDNRPSSVAQRALVEGMRTYTHTRARGTVQRKSNTTGLPDQLKSGIENLSGYAMDDVKVHYNSSAPAQLSAHAYAQGSNIHVAPGQEKHLAHEAWHVVQQKQGRVRPTMQMKSKVNINDDVSLEREADVMGTQAMQLSLNEAGPTQLKQERQTVGVVQRVINVEGADKSVEEWYKDLDHEGLDDIKRQAILKALHELDGSILKRAEFDLALKVRVEKIEAELRADSSSSLLRDDADAGPLPSGPADVVSLEHESKEDGDGPSSFSSSGMAIGIRKKDKRLKKKAVAEREEIGFMSTAKTGLELTFSSKESKRFLTNSGPAIADHREAVKWWQDMCDEWTGSVEAPKGWRLESGSAGANKDFGGGTGDLDMYRVTYFGDAEEVFWWQMSMDPGVIEIQTSPVTAAQMQSGPIGEIINSIFTAAAIHEFEAGGGGGHLNVDFVTGFGGREQLIPHVLRATEAVVRRLRDVEHYASLIDRENESEDPFLSTPRVRMQAAKGGVKSYASAEIKDEGDHEGSWIDDVYEKTKKGTLKKFREAHAEWLRLHPTIAQYKKAGTLNEKMSGAPGQESVVLHYQAVNIDHLFDAFDAESEHDPRRLEFRFFASQRDINDIIKGLEVIEMIVKEAMVYERAK
jgi:hypothetical protein